MFGFYLVSGAVYFLPNAFQPVFCRFRCFGTGVSGVRILVAQVHLHLWTLFSKGIPSESSSLLATTSQAYDVPSCTSPWRHVFVAGLSCCTLSSGWCFGVCPALDASFSLWSTINPSCKTSLKCCDTQMARNSFTVARSISFFLSLRTMSGKFFASFYNCRSPVSWNSFHCDTCLLQFVKYISGVGPNEMA